MKKTILVYEVKHYKEVTDDYTGESEMIPVTEQEYANGDKYSFYEVLEGLKNTRPVQM